MIRFERMEDFVLPDEFVYVCNATGSGSVNLTPIYQLGKERLKKLVILCGSADLDSEDEHDEREALKPAAWLKRFAIKELGLCERRDIEIIGNDPDGFEGWKRASDAAIKLAKDASAVPIIVNLQGGTKQMSHAIEHYLERAEANWMRLFLGKYPPISALVVMVGNDFKRVFPKEIAEQPPFEVLLDAANVAIVHKALPVLKSDETFDQSAVAAKLFAALNATDGKKALRTLNTAHYQYAKNNIGDFIIGQHVESHFFRICERIYKAAIGAVMWNDGNLGTGFRKEFLTGVWLETYITDRIRDAVVRQPQFNVQSQIALKEKNSFRQKNSEALEIDVILQQDACFHLIEAKSSVNPAEIVSYARKLGGNAAAIAGMPGKNWIVAPFVTFKDKEEQKDIEERCELWKIKLLTGCDAIDLLIEAIERLG